MFMAYDPVVVLILGFGIFTLGHAVLWFISRTGYKKGVINPPFPENFKGYHLYIIALNSNQGFEAFPAFQMFLILHGTKDVSHQIHVCKQGNESSIQLVRALGTTILMSSTVDCLGEIKSITVVIRGEPGHWNLRWIKVYDKSHAQMWKFNVATGLHITIPRTIYSFSTYLFPKKRLMKYHNWLLLFEPYKDDVHVSNHDRMNIMFASFVSCLALSSMIPLVFSLFDVDKPVLVAFVCIGCGTIMLNSNSILDFIQHLSGKQIHSREPVVFYKSQNSPKESVIISHSSPTNRKNEAKSCIVVKNNSSMKTGSIYDLTTLTLDIRIVRVIPIDEFCKFKKLLISKGKKSPSENFKEKNLDSENGISENSLPLHKNDSNFLQVPTKPMAYQVAMRVLKSKTYLLKDLKPFDSSSNCSEISSLSESFDQSSLYEPSCSSSPSRSIPSSKDRSKIHKFHMEAACGSSNEMVHLTDKEKKALSHITFNVNTVLDQGEVSSESIFQDSLNTLWIPKDITIKHKMDHWIYFFQHWRNIQNLMFSLKTNILLLQNSDSYGSSIELSFIDKFQLEIFKIIRILQADSRENTTINNTTLNSSNENNESSDEPSDEQKYSLNCYDRYVVYILKNFTIQLTLIVLEHMNDFIFLLKVKDYCLPGKMFTKLHKIVQFFCNETSSLRVFEKLQMKNKHKKSDKKNASSLLAGSIPSQLHKSVSKSEIQTFKELKRSDSCPLLKNDFNITFVEKLPSDAEYNTYQNLSKSSNALESVLALTGKIAQSLQQILSPDPIRSTLYDFIICSVFHSNSKNSRSTCYNFVTQVVQVLTSCILQNISYLLTEELQENVPVVLLQEVNDIVSKAVNEFPEKPSNAMVVNNWEMHWYPLSLGDSQHLQMMLNKFLLCYCAFRHDAAVQCQVKQHLKCLRLHFLMSNFLSTTPSTFSPNSVCMLLNYYIPSLYNKLKTIQKILKVLGIITKEYCNNDNECNSFSSLNVDKQIKKSLREIYHAYSHVNTIYLCHRLNEEEDEIINKLLSSKTKKGSPVKGSKCNSHNFYPPGENVSLSEGPCNIQFTPEELVVLEDETLGIPKPLLSPTAGAVSRSIIIIEITVSVLITVATGFISEVMYTFIFTIILGLAIIDFFICQVIKSIILAQRWKRPVQFCPSLCGINRNPSEKLL